MRSFLLPTDLELRASNLAWKPGPLKRTASNTALGEASEEENRAASRQFDDQLRRHGQYLAQFQCGVRLGGFDEPRHACPSVLPALWMLEFCGLRI